MHKINTLEEIKRKLQRIFLDFFNNYDCDNKFETFY